MANLYRKMMPTVMQVESQQVSTCTQKMEQPMKQPIEHAVYRSSLTTFGTVSSAQERQISCLYTSKFKVRSFPHNLTYLMHQRLW